MRQALQSHPSISILFSLLKHDEHACQYFDHNGPEIWLEWIERTGGKKGDGRRALEAILAVADEKNVLVRLFADDEALFEYYASLGFERDPAGGEIMERLPGRSAPSTSIRPGSQ